ncbi:hypothetical protein F5Y09DRAFT_163369 [Xylaria sp. FL1042]|nr:hypothetical protein F5Y09DRAFT_163369 [Xylaria sp. FL1042]
MPNAGPQGGWGAGTTTAPSNPFNVAAPPALENPFAKPPPNPFSQLNKTNPQAPTNNPFGAPTKIANPFSPASVAIPKRPTSPPFQQTTKSAINARNPFEPAKKEISVPASQSSKPPTNIRRPSPGTIANGSRKVAEFVQPAWPDEPNKSTPWISDFTSSNKRKGGISVQSNGQNSRSSPVPVDMAGKRKPASRPGSTSHNTGFPTASSHSSKTHDGRSRGLASKIQEQLTRDRIKPPQWPPNPGSHAQRQAMENFRESYKAYREKARKSLIRAGLIDDPDRRRTLQQALDFRGISEEMCPEWEKITRIIEYDIRNPEKAPDDSGDLVAMPSLMVKRLARSAAGQDAPLPMDVRSFATLRKTLDYLIDDLIPDDSLLPSKHSFLWDRTRAIRIDLSVQKYNLTPDERKDLIYCLETIARFHVTALHLLSQDGFAAEDFSEQQEIEQLGKTLISLKELYDDCVEQNIDCVNEAEFRGYYIVFNARNPSIKETVEGWPARLWNTDGIRTAMCLVESLQNTWALQGPLNPSAPTELALSAASIFFSIVASPEISYTMACFAEIHFNEVRKSMLQILRKAYTRPREGPKDITPTFLKERMRFDTEDEAVDFAQKHGIVFGQDDTQRYAILNSRQPIEDPRIRHAFSRNIVERKRSGHSLPDIIHQTVFEEPSKESQISSREDGLFVDEESNTSFSTSNGIEHESETDSVNSTIHSSPPITTNAQSPSNTSTSSQPQATIDSHVTQPIQTFKHPTTSASPLSLFAPAQDSKYQTTGSIAKQPDDSSLGPNGDTINSGDERSQLNANKLTSTNPFPQSLFSFLNSNDKGSSTLPPNEPSKSGSTLDESSKPSFFPASDAGSKSTVAPAWPPATVSTTSLKSSSAPTSIQGHSFSGSRSIFEQVSSPAVSSNTGPVLGTNFPTVPASDKSSPSRAQQDNSLKESASSNDSSSMQSKSPREKPNTAQKRIPSLSTPTAMVTKRDPMDDFTRWFVLGDRGLMEEKLEALAVEHVLKAVWEDYQAAKEMRIRQEEDEKSWAEALQFRRYSLKVTFFYRWRDITRKRRIIKRIQLEKEKARKWKSPQMVAERENAKVLEREQAVQEAKELVEKRTREHTQETTKMRGSTQSRQSLEEDLLATGVFNGVQDARAAAQNATRDDDDDAEYDMLPAEKQRLRSENQRRRRRGLPPLKQFPKVQASKEGSKTALLRAISSGAGRDSLSMSTGSLRNSTFSSSYRSSLGFNKTRVGKCRQKISDPYWRMKANGLVLMPNGEYLHETLALPMLQEGKRFPGLGDYGLPPQESFTPSQSPPTGLDLEPGSDSPTPDRFQSTNQVGRSPLLHDAVAQKRKRGQTEDDDLAAYRSETPAGRKRAKSHDRTAQMSPSSDQDFLDSIAHLLNRVNAVTNSST